MFFAFAIVAVLTAGVLAVCRPRRSLDILPRVITEQQKSDLYLRQMEKREAFRCGLTVEEYRRVLEEERIQEAMGVLDITREEVLAGDFHTMASFELAAEATARRRSLEHGKPFTAQDILDEYDRNLVSNMSGDVSDVQCLRMSHDGNIAEFAATGSLKDSIGRKHLQVCDDCSRQFTQAHEEYLSPAGPDCLTSGEVGSVEETGHLPKDRQPHMRTCRRCYLHAERAEQVHLSGPLGPDCYKPEEMQVVERTGELSAQRLEHKKRCRRCQDHFDHHFDRYLDIILPLPRLSHPLEKNTIQT